MEVLHPVDKAQRRAIGASCTHSRESNAEHVFEVETSVNNEVGKAWGKEHVSHHDHVHDHLHLEENYQVDAAMGLLECPSLMSAGLRESLALRGILHQCGSCVGDLICRVCAVAAAAQWAENAATLGRVHDEEEACGLGGGASPEEKAKKIVVLGMASLEMEESLWRFLEASKNQLEVMARRTQMLVPSVVGVRATIREKVTAARMAVIECEEILRREAEAERQRAIRVEAERIAMELAEREAERLRAVERERQQFLAEEQRKMVAEEEEAKRLREHEEGERKRREEEEKKRLKEERRKRKEERDRIRKEQDEKKAEAERKRLEEEAERKRLEEEAERKRLEEEAERKGLEEEAERKRLEEEAERKRLEEEAERKRLEEEAEGIVDDEASSASGEVPSGPEGMPPGVDFGSIVLENFEVVDEDDDGHDEFEEEDDDDGDAVQVMKGTLGKLRAADLARAMGVSASEVTFRVYEGPPNKEGTFLRVIQAEPLKRQNLTMTLIHVLGTSKEFFERNRKGSGQVKGKSMSEDNSLPGGAEAPPSAADDSQAKDEDEEKEELYFQAVMKHGQPWERQIPVHKMILCAGGVGDCSVPHEVVIPAVSSSLFNRQSTSGHVRNYMRRVANNVVMTFAGKGVRVTWWQVGDHGLLSQGAVVVLNLDTGKLLVCPNRSSRSLPIACDSCHLSLEVAWQQMDATPDKAHPILGEYPTEDAVVLEEAMRNEILDDKMVRREVRAWAFKRKLDFSNTANCVKAQGSRRGQLALYWYSIGVSKSEGGGSVPPLRVQVFRTDPLSPQSKPSPVTMCELSPPNSARGAVLLTYLRAEWFLSKLLELHRKNVGDAGPSTPTPVAARKGAATPTSHIATAYTHGGHGAKGTDERASPSEAVKAARRNAGRASPATGKASAEMARLEGLAPRKGSDWKGEGATPSPANGKAAVSGSSVKASPVSSKRAPLRRADSPQPSTSGQLLTSHLRNAFSSKSHTTFDLSTATTTGKRAGADTPTPAMPKQSRRRSSVTLGFPIEFQRSEGA